MIAAVAVAVLIGALGLRLAAVLRPARSLRETGRSPRSRSISRRRAPTAQALAAYLDAVAREVRAGHHLNAALAAVREPPGLAIARHDSDAAVVIHTLTAVAEIGGAVAPELDAAAAVLRERAAVMADAAAYSAQARLSARILTVVPLGFAAWGVAANQRTRDAYLHSAIGIGCVGAGLLLNFLGWWWMRRIIGGAA